MKRFLKRISVFVLVAVVAGIVVYAVRSSGSDSNCINVNTALANAIHSGLNEGISGSGWKAVESSDDVYAVAAQLSGPGTGEDTVAVWATKGEETIRAVNDDAQSFSSWPQVGTTDAGITVSDDAVQEAEDCVS